MVCEKCAYQDQNEKQIFGAKLCSICSHFAPQNKEKFKNYISEKIDWKIIDSFRKYNQNSSQSQKLKSGMSQKAKQGSPVTRPPLGYEISEGKLIPNQFSSKIHSLFKTFLEKDYSLNSISKNYGVSVNGLKKILSNRTYLGEIKFAGILHKGNHEAIISPEIFYAVQRKLKEKLKPRN